jgi:glutathione S-transferase
LLISGQHLTESFAKDVNRFNKVPAIKEGDIKLSESVAIFHFLGRKGIIPSTWYPKDAKKLAKIDEYLQWQHGNLFNGAGILFYMQWVIPIQTGVKPIAEDIKEQIDFLNKNLYDLENIWLKENSFLIGNEISFADLMAVSMIEQVVALKLFKLDIQKYPKVSNWINYIRNYFGVPYIKAHEVIKKYGSKIASKFEK